MNGMLRIVVAHDDRILLNELKEMVESLGHDVVGTAQTTRETVETCRLCEPDLVVTSVSMPDDNGLEAQQVIQTQADVPVISLEKHKGQRPAQPRRSAPFRQVSRKVGPKELKRAIDQLMQEPSCAARPRVATPASNWFG